MARVRLIIAIHAVANFMIGLSLLLWSNFSAESVLNMLFPFWLWPCMFMAAGFMAVIGIWSRPFAQFAYAFAGIVTAVFGIAGFISVIQMHNLAAVASTVFLLYIAIMKFEIAYMITQMDNVVQSITEATRQARISLEDSISHGPDARRSK